MYKPKSKLPESAFRSQESQPKEEQAPSKPVRYLSFQDGTMFVGTEYCIVAYSL